MTGRERKTRPAFSLLEVQFAFVLLGIALAGLCPLLVLQSRQLRQIENRLNHQTTYYLIPSTDPWARKLGASASVQTTDPGPPSSAANLVIDNGSTGYSETGTGWRSKDSTAALGGSYHWHMAGTGQNSVTWIFSGLPVGAYSVQASWPGNSRAASNATYTISDGSQVLATVTADQQAQPADNQYQGVWWSKLCMVALNTNTLQVTLTDNANGGVDADGMMLVALPNGVEILSLDHSLTTEDLTAHVTVTPPGS